MVTAFLASLLFTIPVTDRLIPTPDGLYANECDPPLLVVFDPRLDASSKRLALQAMDYWNDIIGYEFFIEVDVPNRPLPPQGYVIVRPELGTDAFDERACAVTSYKTEVGTGCMAFVQVVVMPLCKPMGEKLMLSVWRHELGHVLGLSHNDVPGDLMRPTIPRKGNPLHATPDDVGVIRELYGK